MLAGGGKTWTQYKISANFPLRPPTVPSGSGSRGVREMLLDAETRRRGETRGESLFRIGFRACKATQESQNLRARRQRRAYGFAARLTLGWKADQGSVRRIPQLGLVHVGSPIRAATVRSCEGTASSRNWQANHIFSQLLRERKGAPKPLPPASRYVEHESTARTALQRRSIRLDHPLRGTRYPPPRAHQERLRAWDWARTRGPRRHRQRTQARTR